MSIRKVSFMFGEYYHIYNRGNSKQKIFHDKEDYNLFIKLLLFLNKDFNVRLKNLVEGSLASQAKEHPIVSIGAYCLMPNHFHILITPTENGSISKFMQKLSTAYVMYYNKKYNRTGSLFEGKFKSQHLDNDAYLKYMFSYIHLNPIKLIDSNWKQEGIKDTKASLNYLNKYFYSSYLDYHSPNSRTQDSILNKSAYPDYFGEKESFQNDILLWLNYHEEIQGKTL